MDNEPTPGDYRTNPGLEAEILEILQAAGKDIGALTPADLAPVDEFHIRGRKATRELAALAGVSRGWHVLDVGSGLGGSARFLASEYGCLVTGLDAMPLYCEVAARLSQRLALARLTRFEQGDALALPYADGVFDLVWTEHAQMSIADKEQFYGEIARVLKPGGRLAFNDIFQGPGGSVRFPVPWALDPAASHLVTPVEARALLEGIGLSVREWRDVSGESLAAFEQAVQHARAQGPPPLGTHLLTNADALTLLQNQRRNLAEGRIAVVEAVLDAPPR